MGRCSKDKRDKFYRLAKEEGFRARSAFKLLQINDQFEIFDGVCRAVDLCAAPGSWSQILAKAIPRYEFLGIKLHVLAVDIQTIAPIDGVVTIQGDITSQETADKIIEVFNQEDRPFKYKADLVVCDGAPDVTGQHDLDEFVQSQLLLAALNIATFILEKGGTFVAKIFRGQDISLLIAQFRIFFETVQVVKPKSSRTSSIEAFIVCKKFRLPLNYKPKMFDLLTDIESISDETENNSKTIIPFLMCGDLNDLK